MVDGIDMKELAAQLRKPDGAVGLETGEHMNRSNRHMNMLAIKALDVNPNDNILEIGMGNGEFVRGIVGVDTSVRYTGFDYSHTMINEATKRNELHIQNGQVKFVFGNADDMPFEDNSFNKAIGVNTIYFWEPSKELRELHRVLSPNGKLVIGIRAKDMMRDSAYTKYGFTLYSKEELGEVLVQNAFSLVSLAESPDPPMEIDGNTIVRRTVVAVAVPIK